MSTPNKQPFLNFVCNIVFIVVLGWTIPYMLVMPFVRTYQVFAMVGSGNPIFLGSDLTLLVPCTAAVCYIFFGHFVRRFWSRFPWFAPLIAVAFSATVGTTLMAHLSYTVAAGGSESAVIGLVALATFIIWRTVVVLSAIWRPLETLIVPRLG